MKMSFPSEILEQIIDYCPPSLNVCLVCKQFNRKRKPLTLIHENSYRDMLTNPWWVNELFSNHHDNRNVLEYLLYICAKNQDRGLFDRVVNKLPMDDPMHQRLQMYNQSIIMQNFNVRSCILDGNLALLLHGFNTEVRVRTFPTMILCALQRRHLFLATYLIFSDHYGKGNEEYAALIAIANLEVLKWFDKFQAYDDDFLMLHLILNDKVDAFEYFQKHKQIAISDQMLNCAEKNRSVNVVMYMTSVVS